MSKELLKRTKLFTRDVIQLAEMLPDTFLGKHIRGQIIRSATSVSANYRAARLAQSRAAFIAKISIVIEEADETAYWSELIEDEKLVVDQLLHHIKNEADEITSILIASRKTMQKKN